MPFLQVGVADVGCEPFILRGKLWDLSSLLIVGCTKDGFCGRIGLSLPAHFDEFPSHLLDGKRWLCQLLDFFQSGFGVSWEEAGSGSSWYPS